MIERFTMALEHDWVCARDDEHGAWVRYSDHIEFLSRTGAVKVKPLDWEEIHQRRSDEDPSTEVVGFEAPTGFSEWYSIDTRVADFVLHLPDSDGSTSLHETEREAKAAAQADYERRITAALAQEKGR